MKSWITKGTAQFICYVFVYLFWFLWLILVSYQKQPSIWSGHEVATVLLPAQITKFMGPTWGPPGSCRPQMGPMLAPWTLLSGWFCYQLIANQVTRQPHLRDPSICTSYCLYFTPSPGNMVKVGVALLLRYLKHVYVDGWGLNYGQLSEQVSQ